MVRKRQTITRISYCTYDMKGGKYTTTEEIELEGRIKSIKRMIYEVRKHVEETEQVIIKGYAYDAVYYELSDEEFMKYATRAERKEHE